MDPRACRYKRSTARLKGRKTATKSGLGALNIAQNTKIDQHIVICVVKIYINTYIILCYIPKSVLNSV